VNQLADLEPVRCCWQVAGAMKGNLAKAAGLFTLRRRRSPDSPRPLPISVRPKRSPRRGARRPGIAHAQAQPAVDRTCKRGTATMAKLSTDELLDAFRK